MGFEIKSVKSKKDRRCELTKKVVLKGEQYTAVILIDKLDIHINGFKYRGNYDYHVFHSSVPLEDIYTRLLGKDMLNYIVDRAQIAENVSRDNVRLRYSLEKARERGQSND